ncbi:hypothetical protein KDH_35030 [Dictyobacter sp. S3.2.2.5]|uniref:Uncharacterized protein n=1 Tax=Dictyobacter halimunensis TaxID=3026934 RepID=A0ABQ6FQW8_9CHLR|nr:hypothetical protein KDH_35030 [Dictyobacter sp. S3.2.2.5]
MSKVLSIDTTEQVSLKEPPNTFVKRYTLLSACVYTILSVVMLILSFFTPLNIAFRGQEIAVSLSTIIKVAEIVCCIGMLHAAVMLWMAILREKHIHHGIGVLPGDAALANAFLYFGFSMTAFHLGYTSPMIALAQFIAALSGLIFGTGGLILSGVSKPARPLGHITFSIMLRDGVILIVGTILFAIAIGQLAGDALKPPQWNWISFLGIAVPGMFLLIGREGIRGRVETWQGLGWIPRLLVTDTLLILGLTIMFYGSYFNLTVGLNGYQVGPKGNIAGLLLWIIAVFLLLLVRGVYKIAIAQKGDNIGYRMISKLFYVVAIVLFFYGERSFLSGHAPVFAVGKAAPAVALILLAAFVILTAGRTAAQKVKLLYVKTS